MQRQIVLDTETTGLHPDKGHKIIEIACIELIDFKPTGYVFHSYINPGRDIDEHAFRVHGISRNMLEDEPCFGDIFFGLYKFLGDDEIIIHNAKFDMGFLEAEFNAVSKLMAIKLKNKVVCTLEISKQITLQNFGNKLDDLCHRYGIDNTKRALHGALIDARLLSKVYLHMRQSHPAYFSEPESKEAA